jgi:starch-binding outer membrane protein, SusD/RagB family
MKFYLVISIGILCLAACRKENNGPAENYTEDYIFDPVDQNGIVAQQVLANIYTHMSNGFNRVGGDFLDAATDDAIPSRYGATISAITDANLNTGHPDDAWESNYAGIRKVNLFMSRVGAVPKPAEVAIWKGEVRFLRALFYFELLKRYGGIPIAGDTVYKSGDVIDLPRNSFEACVNYIVTECDAIKGVVRAEPIANADFGKASRGAVLALKARVLLYAASPLYNGGVPAEASPSQRSVMGYASFDPERWNKAAQAANELLTLNVYPLEGSFNNVFLNRKNNEVILPYLRATTTDLERVNGPVGYSDASSGAGATSPTQHLVDAFPMLNGKPITDPTSGYDAANPYNNRDPRLGNTVLRNGAMWLNRPLQTFEGGLDKPNRGNVQTRTGYYLRKFLGNFSTATQYAAQNHNFPVFRSAEVMLNYAEALNEYSGPVTAVVTQITNLRKRAGMAAGADNRYGVPAGITKEDMRELIRNERRIELAFEEHRYWDLRRWKRAADALNKTLTGVRITQSGSTLTYEPLNAAPIRFLAPQMYYYAIPRLELTRNTNLIQNYGW